MPSQKISTFRTLLVIIQSLALTGYYSFKVVFHSLFKPVAREQVDAWLESWSTRLNGYIGLQTKVIETTKLTFEKNKRYIIMSNHESLYDIPVIFRAFPKKTIRMLAKIEISRIPLFGSAMRKAEFVFINRHDREKAIQDLNQIKKQMESGIIPWIAPEGTRSRTGKLLPFKKGGFITAINTGAIIIPVGIRGTSRVLPAKSLHFSLNETAEVHVGEPIDCSELTLDDKENLLEKVRKQIIALSAHQAE